MNLRACLGIGVVYLDKEEYSPDRLRAPSSIRNCTKLAMIFGGFGVSALPIQSNECPPSGDSSFWVQNEKGEHGT